MKTISKIFALAAMATMLTAASPDTRGAGVSFPSAEVAYDQGIGAMRTGRLEIAATALEFAARREHVPAIYYLAKIYANNSGNLTDHARAFSLFGQIVEKFAYIDPSYDFRARYVSRAFIEYAKYFITGVATLNQPQDLRYAVALLNHAASYYGDNDAQFELAKMYLTGDGLRADPRRGRYWLWRLAQQNHAGAQAFLADLYWRGMHVKRDPAMALFYARLAVVGAPEQDRIWIDEIHQTVFCGAPTGVRQKAGQMVAEWSRRVPQGDGGSTNVAQGAVGVGAVGLGGGSDPGVGRERPRGGVPLDQISQAVRTCGDGTAVEDLRFKSLAPAVKGMPTLPASRADGTMDAGMLAGPSLNGATDDQPLPMPGNAGR